MSDITYYDTGARMSQAVAHNGVLITAGQVGLDTAGQSYAAQTRDILARLDAIMAKAGTSKDRILSATIWLADIGAGFAEMNEVWDAWVVPGKTPARACVESKLAAPQFTVEIQLTVAM